MSPTLKEIEPFHLLPPHLINDAEMKGGILIKEFDKNFTFLHQNKAYENLFVLLEGICVGEMYDPSGKNMKIEEFQGGDILAAGILFSCDNELPVSVTTYSKSKVAIITKKTILNFCMNSEPFLISYMKLISDKVAFLSKKILFINFKSIKSKVAHFLISKLKENKKTVNINMSIEELAQYFGVARPSLSRVIADMQAEGLIEKDKNIYTILDLSALYHLT